MSLCTSGKDISCRNRERFLSRKPLIEGTKMRDPVGQRLKARPMQANFSSGQMNPTIDSPFKRDYLIEIGGAVRRLGIGRKMPAAGRRRSNTVFRRFYLQSSLEGDIFVILERLLMSFLIFCSHLRVPCTHLRASFTEHGAPLSARR